jgi:transposase-like protein
LLHTVSCPQTCACGRVREAQTGVGLFSHPLMGFPQGILTGKRTALGKTSTGNTTGKAGAKGKAPKGGAPDAGPVALDAAEDGRNWPESENERRNNSAPKQEAAIAALLTADSITEAAKMAGVGERTLRRWLAEDEAFKREYRAARRQLVHHAATRLHQAMGDAVKTLETVMGDDMAPPGARVMASKTVIELGHRAFEVGDLSQELEDLREQLAELRRLRAVGNAGVA